MSKLNNHIVAARKYLNDNRETLAERRREADEIAERIAERYDLHIGGNDEAIAMALDPEHEAFATTSLYWDCECDADYIKSSQIDMCSTCGHYAEDQPDSRINEIIGEGLPLNLDDSKIRLSVEFHSIGCL